MAKFFKNMLNPFLFNSLKIVYYFLMNTQKKTAISKQPFRACQPYGILKAITTIKII